MSRINLDEFAFANQQLAAMLRSGIPLEGGLRQLCTEMQGGALRQQLRQLEGALAKGLPPAEAVAGLHLPEFYVQMVQVGLKSNNLPGMLLLLADYYREANHLRTRLKGLVVYPLIVFAGTLALSLFLASCYATLANLGLGNLEELGGRSPPPLFEAISHPTLLTVSLFAPSLVLLLAVTGAVAGVAVPALRRWLRWRLPGFKEAVLAQFAAAMSLMLKGGCPLAEAARFLLLLEKGTPLGAELARWQARLASGTGKLADLAQGNQVLPPLFLWLLANAGEDVGGGFQQAAEIYGARAAHRRDVFLYALLPSTILVLGCLVVVQAYSLFGMILGRGVLLFNLL